MEFYKRLLKLFNVSVSTIKDEKNNTALVFFLLLFLITPAFLNRIPSMDEIWSYQFSRRIFFGYIPYKDFNLLALPFSAQAGCVFLSIFSDKLIVLRFLGIIVTSICGITIYKIIRVLGITRFTSLIWAFVYTLLIYMYPENSYSWFSVMFLTIALLLELINVKKNINTYYKVPMWLLTGIFIGLSTISKQNVGAFGLLVSLLMPFMFLLSIGIRKGKSEVREFNILNYIKNTFAEILSKLFGWAVVFGVEVFYLWRMGTINEFVDFVFVNPEKYAASCFLPYNWLLFKDFNILAVLVPLTFTILLVKGFFSNSNTQKQVYLLVSLYSIANFIIVFPISCSIHMTLATPISIAGFALLAGNVRSNSKFTRSLSIIFVLSIVLFSAISFGKYLVTYNQFPASELKHYEYIPLRKEMVEEIKEIDSYILKAEEAGKKVYIFDFSASWYMIPLDIFPLKYDPMFRGTFGSRGEGEIYHMLDSSNNIVILVRKENLPANWLEYRGFYSYIRENMKQIGQIGRFDIFAK